MSVMHVEVVSGEENIYSGEASFVVVPTVAGELGIFPRHEPIMSLVRPGALRLTVPNSQEEVLVAVSGGVLEVQPDKITVLADVAIRSAEMDAARAEEAKRAAENNLSQAKDGEVKAKAQAALAAAIAELKTLGYLRNRKK
ncbi:F0F1 ATP synthase subunit epsilon [Kingella negevensis]|uniref:ATP synthase epsilon chain n=1 Tax=Kingella negevensis TaxID=1522312 RepID=A0A238HHL9_9NEIS|nr:F0F1 ATP synthase subunit epsilon [Kingella negevensis]MDK4679661.1 F0F1 ATP synthase subunit epsilon [Kingella negevensis]MDK4682620.1 F0F1 ATP synthase subunit epsilon [Kingella negevensis]MDK4684163.1 F0F1 ATP synthase subunit epsilon [Kingella negevensis]MDK4690817.1 F0F1 ATP synthase subunit epsilon [Kingella negevensis]MDK4694036.1 F0F1 ATP synthase subunit epsilon [Kingella negevensis]